MHITMKLPTNDPIEVAKAIENISAQIIAGVLSGETWKATVAPPEGTMWQIRRPGNLVDTCVITRVNTHTKRVYVKWSNRREDYWDLRFFFDLFQEVTQKPSLEASNTLESI